MRIGAMVWRIGDCLGFFEQLDWLRCHHFEAVAFWTCVGQPGVWEGFDFAAAHHARVTRLSEALAGFASVDLHAATPLTAADDSTEELLRTVAFAGKIAGATVTVHLEAPVTDALVTMLRQLDRAAEVAGVRIGLELTDSYDLALRDDLPCTGFTLDVGHVSMGEGAGYREFGSLPGLIEHMAPRLFHVHAHDYDGALDHLAVGAGALGWPGIMQALQRGGYEGVVCLELNPDRASPEDLVASRERLLAEIGRRTP